MENDVIAKDEHMGWACDCPHEQDQCGEEEPPDDFGRIARLCTRPVDHDGPHSSCYDGMHPGVAWWE